MNEIEIKRAAKKIEIRMSLLMGVTLSFFLSLTGLLTSGHFTWPSLLINFAVSFIISILIGFLVPLKKISAFLDAKLGLIPGKLSTHFFETLLSDCIYTPLITLCMVFAAWKQAVSHGAQIPFWPMFGKSLIISMIGGYILIFVFMPLFLKISGAYSLMNNHENAGQKD